MIRSLWIARTGLDAQQRSMDVIANNLANVSTTARLEGDEWVISGQKVWTSLAHVADWCQRHVEIVDGRVSNDFLTRRAA